ncbi:hypothetical protein L6452_03678 [Arctium lappa]|uniref:Uncharacterized protein n=1 Tax=Arctium lappa TaxID=4217 RepID=A0ACB9FN16_ARCLA|nr:hypothetical protein L6452_03678 [Arctium lappa]
MELERDSDKRWEVTVDGSLLSRTQAHGHRELLDLGEAIGSESRGLSQELIDSLPTTRYKSGGFFLRKKSAERTVVGPGFCSWDSKPRRNQQEVEKVLETLQTIPKEIPSRK